MVGQAGAVGQVGQSKGRVAKALVDTQAMVETKAMVEAKAMVEVASLGTWSYTTISEGTLSKRLSHLHPHSPFLPAFTAYSTDDR